MTLGIVGPIIETTKGLETETVTEMIVGTTIDQIIEEMIVIKSMAIGTKFVVGLETEMEGIEAAPGRVSNPGAVARTDTRIEGKVETTTEMGTGLSLDPDPLLV